MIVREEIIGDCRLILGDCLEVLPTLPEADLVLTDPPYGIGADAFGANATGGYWRDYGAGGWDAQRPSAECFSLLSKAGAFSIIWGGNYFADQLPPTKGWLVWDKTQRGLTLSDAELAWTNLPGPLRVFSLNRAAIGDRTHPTQKPAQLMSWCLEYADAHCGVSLPVSMRTRNERGIFVKEDRRGNEIAVVLDPFMGSGTTGVACAKMGRKFIGIEIDEGYFNIACDRIRKAYAQPDMFVSAPTPQPEQLSILDEAS